jgi:YD repeat-containing protein
LDAQGRRTGQVETIGGSTRNWTYGHDNLDRLIAANVGSATETYAYDIWGNRTRHTTVISHRYGAS